MLRSFNNHLGKGLAPLQERKNAIRKITNFKQQIQEDHRGFILGNSSNNGRTPVQNPKTRRYFVKKPYLLSESDPMYRKPKPKKTLSIRLPQKTTIIDRVKRNRLKIINAAISLLFGFLIGCLIASQ